MRSIIGRTGSAAAAVAILAGALVGCTVDEQRSASASAPDEVPTSADATAAADEGGSEASGTDDGGEPIECVDGRILVGVAKAESGPASFFDVAGTRGMLIAIEEINEAGGLKGCPIETIIEDTQSDPAVAAQVARSLIGQGAQILVVADDFDTGVAAARLGQEAGILTLSAAGSSTEFAAAVGDLFFNAGITTIELGKAQAQYALDQEWLSTFQVLDPGLAYFTEQDEYFRELYEAGGGVVQDVDQVDSLGGQADYATTISKIRNADPDVIQALMVFPGVGTFVRQLRSAGIDTPVIGPLTLQTRELRDLVGDAENLRYAAQVYFEGAGEDDATDPEIAAFAEAYEEEFGQFPEQANAPAAYQLFHAVNQALQREDVVDAESAAAAIRSQENLDVPGGTLARWQDGYAVWNPIIGGYDAGEFSLVTEYDATELRE